MLVNKINKKNKKISFPHPLIFLSVFLFVASFAGRLYIASVMASKNIELKELYVKKIILNQDLTRLEYENLQLSSLSIIETRAKQLGFVPLNGLLSSIDIDVSEPLALR